MSALLSLSEKMLKWPSLLSDSQALRDELHRGKDRTTPDHQVGVVETSSFKLFLVFLEITTVR